MSEGAYSTNAPRAVPYDTGKVQIGCRWEPPLYVPSRGEAMIQNALLNRGIERRSWLHSIVKVFK